MKKYIFYLTSLVFIALNIKCSSDSGSFNFTPTPYNDAEEVLVSVTEYGTSLPLPGVKVSTFYCKHYDIEFGKCTDEVLFSSCTTSSEGTCNSRFPKDNFNGVSIEKAQYWFEHYHEIGYQYTLIPEAWIDIHFVTNVEYPATAYFFITVIGNNRFERSFIQASNDSHETLTLFGNQENKIEWVLYETFNASSEVLNSGSFTLNSDKFENLTHTLTY